MFHAAPYRPDSDNLRKYDSLRFASTESPIAAFSRQKILKLGRLTNNDLLKIGLFSVIVKEIGLE
jgi:hypothetical protein